MYNTVWDLDFAPPVLVPKRRIIDRRAFLERALIREFTLARMLVTTTYFDRYLRPTDRKEKCVERNIRLGCRTNESSTITLPLWM